jgi:alpha-ribazole phosphatase
MEELLAKHAGQTIALVTHGGVIRIVLAWAMGLPRDNVFRLGQRYAAVNAIQWFDNYPSVELLNG